MSTSRDDTGGPSGPGSAGPEGPSTGPSEREGTPAAIHFEDVPRAVKTERLGRLVELQKQMSLEQNRAWVGREVEVLVKGATEEEGFVQGHTRGNHVTIIRGHLAPGIHRATVAQATPNRLYCESTATSVDLPPPTRARRELNVLTLPPVEM